MAPVRQMFLSLAAVALLAGPAAAQTYWGEEIETEAGEPMRFTYAYIGNRPNETYSYLIYGVVRSRPEGYFWHQSRTTCEGSAGFAASWGFLRWDGGTQSVGQTNLFSLLPDGFDERVAWDLTCEGYQSEGPTFEGGAEALRALRAWQAASP